MGVVSQECRCWQTKCSKNVRCILGSLINTLKISYIFHSEVFGLKFDAENTFPNEESARF